MNSWIVRLATLVIIGLPLAWAQSGAAADEPKPADPARPDAKKGKVADSSSPITSVNAFFAALKANDLDQLSRATALRAPAQAVGKKNQRLFAAILEQSLSNAELRDLSSAFEGYQVVGMTDAGGRPKKGVLVEMVGRNGKWFERTITVRQEKAGWKVLDYSEPREVVEKRPPPR